MKILDATAGSRGIWYQKNLPFVIFMDKRKGKFVSYFSPKRKRYYDVNPDVVATWDNMPFEKETFDMVLFDPPHIVKNPSDKKCRMEIQYSSLDKSTWKQTLKIAFKELFKVLKPEGFLILKWCETDIKIMEVIKLSPYKPMFSNMSLEHNPCSRDNYMVVFCKYNPNGILDIN